MHFFRPILAAWALAALALPFTPAAKAAPVTFDLASTALTKGAGFGTDLGFLDALRSGSLLGLQTTLSGISGIQPFALEVGQSRSIDVLFARLDSTEPSIDRDETDGLQLTWDFALQVNNALAPTETMVGTASTALGGLGVGGYFRSAWLSRTVSFGEGGSYRLSLSDILLDSPGEFTTQRLTITLLAAPTEPPNPNAVPEPGSLALLGAAFAGLTLARRRRPPLT